jgi:hypothetical protein
VLLSTDDDDARDADGERALLATLKEAPGNVSLDTMLIEIDKLLAVRAIGVTAATFGDVAASVVSGWRARASVESPSHLRTHPEPLRVTLVAALLHEREREITSMSPARQAARASPSPGRERLVPVRPWST